MYSLDLKQYIYETNKPLITKQNIKKPLTAIRQDTSKRILTSTVHYFVSLPMWAVQRQLALAN